MLQAQRRDYSNPYTDPDPYTNPKLSPDPRLNPNQAHGVMPLPYVMLPCQNVDVSQQPSQQPLQLQQAIPTVALALWPLPQPQP